MSLLTKSLCLLVCLCFCFSMTPAVSGQETLSEDEQKGYRKYVLGLFKTYDDDSSGELDAEEMAEMRRKPDMAADSNADGEISVKELTAFYISKANPKSARRKGATSKAKAKSSEGGNVDISVWIVKRSGLMDVGKIKGVSKETVESQLAKVGKDSSMQIEEFHLETMLDHSFRIARGSQVPVVEGKSRSRGGQTISQISQYDVGTRLTATATRNGENVAIEFSVNSSAVEDSDVSIEEHEDDVVYAPTIQTFEFEGSVECESGKATVVQSKEKDGSWALIFCIDAEKE